MSRWNAFRRTSMIGGSTSHPVSTHSRSASMTSKNQRTGMRSKMVGRACHQRRRRYAMIRSTSTRVRPGKSTTHQVTTQGGQRRYMQSHDIDCVWIRLKHVASIMAPGWSAASIQADPIQSRVQQLNGGASHRITSPAPTHLSCVTRTAPPARCIEPAAPEATRGKFKRMIATQRWHLVKHRPNRTDELTRQSPNQSTRAMHTHAHSG